jgi:hypothetical protein
MNKIVIKDDGTIIIIDTDTGKENDDEYWF